MSPRRNWDSPNLYPPSECALPPGPKGGRACDERGGVPVPTTLPTLWSSHSYRGEG